MSLSSKILLLKCFKRFSSTKSRIVVTKSQSTIVAWHPKVDFPYECTRPLPEVPLDQQDTVLKSSFTPELMQTLRKKSDEQARQELMNITYTTKHRWFPKRRWHPKDTTTDRPFL